MSNRYEDPETLRKVLNYVLDLEKKSQRLRVLKMGGVYVTEIHDRLNFRSAHFPIEEACVFQNPDKINAVIDCVLHKIKMDGRYGKNRS